MPCHLALALVTTPSGRSVPFHLMQRSVTNTTFEMWAHHFVQRMDGLTVTAWGKCTSKGTWAVEHVSDGALWL